MLPTFTSPKAYQEKVKKETERRRAIVRRLTDALYDFLTADADEAEAEAAEEERLSAPYGFTREEQLVNATDALNRLQEQMEIAERGLEALPMEGLKDIMRATAIAPLANQIAQQEEYISILQKALESQDSDVPR